MSALDREALEQLVRTATSPCISIFLPTHRAGMGFEKDRVRFKNLLREAADELRRRGLGDPEIEGLLNPAQQLLHDRHYWKHQEDGLAVFIAPERFTAIRMSIRPDVALIVGDRFRVKPLLPLLSGDGRFYVLAVSKNRVRFFAASRTTMQEIDLAGVPTSLLEAVGDDWQEDSLHFHSSAARQRGAKRGPAIYHGLGEGRDEVKKELAKFLRQVDDGIAGLIEDRGAPLVLAGVESVLALLRRVTRHANVLEEAIVGNPDKFGPEELHARAWALAAPSFGDARRLAARRYLELAGTGRTGARLDEVIAAAFDGRVESLFVPLGDARWGSYDVDTRRVDEHPTPEVGDHDLLDLVAWRSLQAGADVFAVARDDLPGDGELAAVYRY